MKSLEFGLLSSISGWASDPVDRPVFQLIFNNETTILPSILYLSLAHKAISSDHDNVSRL